MLVRREVLAGSVRAREACSHCPLSRMSEARVYSIGMLYSCTVYGATFGRKGLEKGGRPSDS